MSSNIQLTEENSCRLLCEYVELAQQKGAFLLSEAYLLKKALDVSLNQASDPEIDKIKACQLLIQAVEKGQRHGAYTLADASLLFNIITLIKKRNERSDTK